MTSYDPKQYVQGVLDQDRRLLAKTITLVESSRSDHQEVAREIIEGLLPHAGKATRLGVSGVPGSGKSTFIESLGTNLIESGHRVAVLAVDPTSKRSGGSVMADKTRMERLSGRQQAFIRPSPAGSTLGGVARKTRETMIVCEAAGFDVMIVETVGVGQSETAVASMTDFFLVLMLAGAGDEIQGIKKGILELVDAVVINKADGDNIQKAEKARREYETALHFLWPASPTWIPPVLTCSALTMAGIEDVWQTVMDHRRRMSKTGELERKRKHQALDWMWTLVEDGVRQHLYENKQVKAALERITRDVEHGRVSPSAAAGELLGYLRS